MSSRRLTMLGRVIPMGGGASLPLSVNFAVLPNGALPAGWSGATWTISSGKAVNVPTLDAEMIDAGAQTFEAAGGVYSWVVKVGQTLINDTDQLKGTSVSSTEVCTWTPADAADLSGNLLTGQWYVYVPRVKKSGGSASIYVYQQAPNIIHILNPTTSYTNMPAAFQRFASNTLIQMNGVTPNGTSMWIDEHSMKHLVTSTLIAVPPAYAQFTGDLIIRSAITTADGYAKGVMACLDDPSSPLNYVAAIVDPLTNVSCRMIKVVNGVPSLLRTGTFTSGNLIELRRSGNSFSLWANGSQQGAAVTVSDATIINNRYHVLFSTGGAGGSANFFVGRP